MRKVSKAKLRTTMDIIRVVLGDDKATMGELGMQLIQMATGVRKRLSAGRGRSKRQMSD